MFNETIDWFNEVIQTTTCSKIVVLSHHAPSGQSVSPRFINDSLNAAFVSGIIEKGLISNKVNMWFHGHVHDTFDYVINDVRVICSPLGYLVGRYSDYIVYQDEYVFEI